MPAVKVKLILKIWMMMIYHKSHHRTFVFVSYCYCFEFFFIHIVVPVQSFSQSLSLIVPFLSLIVCLVNLSLTLLSLGPLSVFHMVHLFNLSGGSWVTAPNGKPISSCFVFCICLYVYFLRDTFAIF